MIEIAEKTVLITGGTGSFGKACLPRVLEHSPQSVRIFSRDELKQSELRAAYADDDRLRFLLGDVRDLERLRLATRGVDLIIHAAALKHVPLGESNPFEVTQTNVIGTQNVATAAIENRVPIVVGLSTDKAVAPTNLYGASKLLAERILAQAGIYAAGVTRLASVRYGNVIGSRGSVIPIFQEQAKSGVVTITDERMTRFLITLNEAVEFVLSSIPLIKDGETFIPKLPSARIVDIAEAFAPGCERIYTGIRPGEKIAEVLLTADEARDARDLGDRLMIPPHRDGPRAKRGETLPDGYRYSSDSNDRWLGVDELRNLAVRPMSYSGGR